MVKNKLEGKDKLTPWEQFLEKKKEKKRLKKKQKVSMLIGQVFIECQLCASHPTCSFEMHVSMTESCCLAHTPSQFWDCRCGPPHPSTRK